MEPSGRIYINPLNKQEIYIAIGDMFKDSQKYLPYEPWLAAFMSADQYQALIDTGALITGMTNREVAAYLLTKGLEVGRQPKVDIRVETERPVHCERFTLNQSMGPWFEP